MISEWDPIKYYVTLFWGVPPLQYDVENVFTNTPRVIADLGAEHFLNEPVSEELFSEL